MRDEMAILKETVKQQKPYIGFLMSTASRQDAQLKSQDVQLKSQDAQLKSQDAQLKSHEAQLKSKDAQLKAQNAQLKAQNAQLKAQDTQLKSQDAQLKSQDAHLKDRDAQLKAQTEHVANLQKAVDRHASTIAQLRHEIGDQSHDAAHLSADQPNPISMQSEVHSNVNARRSQGYTCVVTCYLLEVKRQEIKHLKCPLL